MRLSPLFKELLDIPEGYSVIFLGGGASLQFMQIPANFLIKKAAYINSGTWAKKAMKEAKHFGEVVEIASSSDANYTFYPQVPNTVPADCDYLHLTSNNTIYGTELRVDPDVKVPLISDMQFRHHEPSCRCFQVYCYLCRCTEEPFYGWCYRHHRQG